MHIGQFSLVICSFVLAVTSYFIWPYEPSRLVPILILAGAVPLLVFARIFKRPTVRLYFTRAALVLLFASLGFAYYDRLGGLTQSCRTVDVIVMPFEEARYSCLAQLFDSPAFAKRVHLQFTNENGRLLQQRLSNNRLWQRD